MPVVAATSGALHPETLRLLYDFARLKTDAAEQHAVANSLRSPLTPEQLCQRRGATFARLRMEAQLYSLRASATRLTGKHWAALYASSLLPRSRARARCGFGAFARVPLVVWAWDFWYAVFLPRSPGPCSPTVFRSAICDCLSVNGCFPTRSTRAAYVSFSPACTRSKLPREAHNPPSSAACQTIIFALKTAPFPAGRSCKESQRRMLACGGRAQGGWCLGGAGVASCTAARAAPAFQPEHDSNANHQRPQRHADHDLRARASSGAVSLYREQG